MSVSTRRRHNSGILVTARLARASLHLEIFPPVDLCNGPLSASLSSLLTRENTRGTITRAMNSSSQINFALDFVARNISQRSRCSTRFARLSDAKEMRTYTEISSERPCARANVDLYVHNIRHARDSDHFVKHRRQA